VLTLPANHNSDLVMSRFENWTLFDMRFKQSADRIASAGHIAHVADTF
jgi:hypothetical protein